MKFAYADPPYIGQAKKHYNSEEVDHKQLLLKLQKEYPDGWALSCSSPSLHKILPLCPSSCRIMVWVKPFCSFKPGVNPAYAWEPIIVFGGRKRTRDMPTVRDYIEANITLKKGIHGVKPDKFCFWLFEVFNMQPEDEFVDLFPGSGAVTNAWNEYRKKLLESWKGNHYTICVHNRVIELIN
jgi:hypothetical protein